MICRTRDNRYLALSPVGVHAIAPGTSLSDAQNPSLGDGGRTIATDIDGITITKFHTNLCIVEIGTGVEIFLKTFSDEIKKHIDPIQSGQLVVVICDIISGTILDELFERNFRKRLYTSSDYRMLVFNDSVPKTPSRTRGRLACEEKGGERKDVVQEY
jgi:hypothetical protein